MCVGGGSAPLKKLLPDNAALMHLLQEMDMLSKFHNPPTSTKLKEINNLLTWASCFFTFITAKTDHEAAYNLVVHAQIINQLARKHGRSGWLEYDQNFQQQLHVAGGVDLAWNDK